MVDSTHIRIDLNLHQPVKIQAAIEGISVQKLISRLIREYLTNVDKKAKGRTKSEA